MNDVFLIRLVLGMPAVTMCRIGYLVALVAVISTVAKTMMI
jgi:hypothetical protein